jgi:hypothetical protein
MSRNQEALRLHVFLSTPANPDPSRKHNKANLRGTYTLLGNGDHHTSICIRHAGAVGGGRAGTRSHEQLHYQPNHDAFPH